MIRAKFKLVSVTKSLSCDGHRYLFHAVSSSEVEENKRFSKFTPTGRLEMWVDNPSAEEQLKLGKDYYLDVNEAS